MLQLKTRVLTYGKSVLLWNNHFYGFCVSGLALCSSLYLTDHALNIIFLATIYIATVLYYTQAYMNEVVTEHNQERANWYQKYKVHFIKRQWILLGVAAILLLTSIFKYPNLLHLDALTIVFLLTSAIASYLYNSTSFKKNGFLKSAVIAYVWTIVGGYVPFYLNLKIGNSVNISFITIALYLIQLFIFIFLLAILFDIKDMPSDKKNKIQTIPIQIGLNKLMPKIVLPILLIYIFIDVFQYIAQPYSFVVLILNCFFYFLIYIVAKLAINEYNISRSIIFIDGLMLIKALIGIISYILI